MKRARIHDIPVRRRPAPTALLAAALFCCALSCVLTAAGCSYTRILRNRLPSPHRVEDFPNAVRFQYEAPQAKHVNLCGNWDENSWCGTQGSGRFDHSLGAMQDEDGDGVWEIVIPLKPGRYQYKFAVDWGVRWEPDRNNPLTEDDGYGGSNSVLILQ